MTKIKEILDGNKFRSRQDIGDTTKEDFIFLFKGIDCDIKDVMQDYKYLVGEYLSPLLQYVRLVIWFITFTWGPYKMTSCIIVRLIWTVCGCRKIWGTVRTEAFIFMII